jgi:hypothetical protein
MVLNGFGLPPTRATQKWGFDGVDARSFVIEPRRSGGMVDGDHFESPKHLAAKRQLLLPCVLVDVWFFMHVNPTSVYMSTSKLCTTLHRFHTSSISSSRLMALPV